MKSGASKASWTLRLEGGEEKLHALVLMPLRGAGAARKLLLLEPLRGSPFNMCMAAAAPRLYAVATKDSLNMSGAKMRGIWQRTGCSPSNSDVERAAPNRIKKPCGKHDVAYEVATIRGLCTDISS